MGVRHGVWGKMNCGCRICFLGGPWELQGSRDKWSLFQLLQSLTSIPPFLCKVLTTFKSIRVAQWVSEVAFFACGGETVRQITDVFDTLYLTRDFKIHCCSWNTLLHEPFSNWSCSEINASFKDTSGGVNNRSKEQKQAETLVPWLNTERMFQV